jgi:hypothetical protein
VLCCVVLCCVVLCCVDLAGFVTVVWDWSLVPIALQPNSCLRLTVDKVKARVEGIMANWGVTKLKIIIAFLQVMSHFEMTAWAQRPCLLGWTLCCAP